MKSFFFLSMMSLFCLQAFTQDGPLKKGAIRLNGGIGLISFIKAAGGRTTFPPLTASAEYAISEDMTIGGIVGYTSTEQTYFYSSLGSKDKYTFSHMVIGLRANYYFHSDQKFEFYSGAMLGYDALKAKLISQSRYSSYEENLIDGGGGILYGFQVGGRYKFTPLTSLFAEAGYGIALLNVGLSLHL